MKMLLKKCIMGLILTMVFFLLFAGILCGTDGWSKGINRILMRRDGRHTRQAEQLYALKVIDLSNKQGIKELLYQVIDEVFLYQGLDGDREPFTFAVEKGILKIQYYVNINRPNSFQRLTGDYSAIILALIPGISQIEWKYPEIQAGGYAKMKTLLYDWPMVQEQGFIDRKICNAAKLSVAKSFGASASDLQFLMDHSAYYEKGKMPLDKNLPSSFEEAEMKKELMELPNSYKKATECENIYVGKYLSSAGSRDFNRKVWDAFYKKVQEGQSASIIIGNYNSLENAQPDQAGSIYYSYICYDGSRYYILQDFVGSDGIHDLEGGVTQAKYLLESKVKKEGESEVVYYLTDDASVSWRDVFYSNMYSAVNDLTPAEPVKVVEVVRF